MVQPIGSNLSDDRRIPTAKQEAGVSSSDTSPRKTVAPANFVALKPFVAGKAARRMGYQYNAIISSADEPYRNVHIDGVGAGVCYNFKFALSENGRANRPVKNISCRHMCTVLVTSKERKPNLKVMFSRRALEAADANVFSEAAWLEFLASSHKDVIHIGELGQWVHFQMRKLREHGEPDEHGRLWQHYMIAAGGHVVTVTIDLEPRIHSEGMSGTVRGFDPNYTDEYACEDSDHLDDFEKFTWKSIQFYAAKAKLESIAILTPSAQGRINEHFSGVMPINADAASARLALAMQTNAAVDVKRFHAEIDAWKRRPEALRKLLRAQFRDGSAGLPSAMRDGATAVIDAYGALIEASGIADQGFLKELLLAKDRGQCGLFFATAYGQAAAVWAFRKIAGVCITEQAHWKDVLPAISVEGIPALYMALYLGHVEAIEAYTELVIESGITDQVFLRDLLLTITRGRTGLYRPMWVGDARVIRAYMKLVNACITDPTVLKELMPGRNENGVPALHIAMLKGHAEAIMAYAEFVRASGITDRVFLRDLLLAKDISEKSGLSLAVVGGHAQAIDAYAAVAEAAGMLSDNALVKEWQQQTNTAIQLGNFEVIQACQNLLRVAAAA